MHKLLTDSPGSRQFILGNEAIARGAIEAGVAFVTCYPGTPSSEIPLQFFHITRETDIYFEYSVNEKVALEVGAGAAATGLRTLVTMKHVGVNVAADPLMTLAYVGVAGGMVIVTADDPSLFSSQNEQDNRYYARLSGLPMLEPTTIQELKDLTARAFDLSESLNLPVFLRTTTRLNHMRGSVALGSMQPVIAKKAFQKDPFNKVTVPAVSRRLHQVLLSRQEQALDLAEHWETNQIIGRGPFGLVSNGMAFNYVLDAVKDLDLQEKTSLLKLTFSHPMPRNLCLQFLKQVDTVLVVEELEPVLEQELKALAHDNGLKVSILGKDTGGLSRLFEYNPALVREAVAQAFGIERPATGQVDDADLPDLPQRPPTLCAGCPHRATYYEVKQVYGEDTIYPTDIGCYTLGLLPPISMADFLICMGSSVSSACGFAQAAEQKTVAFIGDSTFFHSGLTGLVNAVHNRHNFTLVILDNGTTAMTGHQPHPGVDGRPMDWNRDRVSIEQVVRGCGVQDVHVIKPFAVKKSIETISRTRDYPGVSVIISEEVCPLFAK
ncbi:MAG: indolepyruvate ferredoxin oxidoreductase subunit alpha, partial [Desulfohalobiaceae bacterium]|nr:indolepyruvate ferredoxin oxidoreductase subunit alpha [Desulfohalobiaceae bacterium]